MRILHIIPLAVRAYGGPVSTLYGMIEIWRHMGIHVDIATTESDYPEGADLKWARVLLFKKSFPQRFSPSDEFEEWLLRCARDYDLAFVHGIWNAFSHGACVALREIGTPYLILPHGSLDPFDLRKKAAIKRVLGPLLVRRILASAAAIVCSTQREAGHLVTYGASFKTEILAWPVRPKGQGDRTRFRKRWGIGDADFVFLFLSRIDYKKGLDIILPAFAKFRRTFPRAKLVIAGSGTNDFERLVKRSVRDLGCEESIIFTGFLSGEEKADAFAGSDCFCLPSRNENFGHAVVESLFYGLPVIITNEVYIDNVIAEHDCGWICAYDSEALEKLFTHIANSPAELRRKREGAGAAAPRFTVRALLPHYRELVTTYARERLESRVGEREQVEEGRPELITPLRLDILHIQGLFSAEHGGPAYSLANACVEQARLGHNVTVRVLEGHANTSPARRLPANIRQGVCRVNFPEKLGYSKEFWRLLEQDRTADIYHLHGAWLATTLMGAHQAILRRRPYMIEMMGSYTEYELKRKWLRKAVARKLYQDRVLHQADCIHVNAVEEGRMLRKLGITTPLVCLPVGVDFGATRATMSRIAGMARVRPRPYVLFLARIHPTKGIEALLAAWEKVLPLAGECQLVIAGTGDPAYVAQCRQLSADLERKGACEWLGRVDEEQKVQLYRDALAYVLPSKNENFGNTVAEALACGTPVITTFNTQWTMLEDRECGWLAHAERDSLAETMARCLQAGKDEQRRRGALGRQMVEAEYSIEVVVAKMIEIYRGIIKGAIPERFLLN